MRLLTIYFLLTLSTICYSQNLKSGGVLKPEQAVMDIRHYTIALNVDPEQKSIDGYTEIDLNLTQPSKTLLFDLVNLLKVSRVTVNKKEQQFTHENDLITIPFSNNLLPGKVKVKIEYGGKPGESERAPWVGGLHGRKIHLEIPG